MVRVLLLTAAFLLYTMSSPALAPAEDKSFSEEDLLLFGDIPIVLTSTLKEQKATEAPSPIYVVTKEEIKKRGYSTLDDVMKDVPGFADISDANESIAAERGAFASTTNKTLILINGHRMNDLNLGRYNTDQYFGMDAVERIEFVHGPGSALYGTGALLGVVNIITKKGADAEGSYARAKAGSFNTEGHYTFGGVTSEGTDIFFNFAYNNSRGAEISQPAERDVVPAGQTKAGGNVYWNKYPNNWSALGSIRRNNTTIHVREGHYIRATPRCPNGSYYDWSLEEWPPSYNEDDFFVDVSHSIKVGENSEIVINPGIHYFELKEQSWINTYGANRLPPLGTRSGQFTEEMHYRLKAYFQGQVNKQLHVTAGYDGIYADFQRSMGWSLTGGTNTIKLSPSYVEKGKLFLSGLFGQAIWDPASRLSVIAGVRYDSFDSQADPAVTPRLGFIFKPQNALVLKLLYGRSYLAPQWAHQRTVSSETQAFRSNSDLNPENMDSVDLIADYSTARVNAWVDVFYNKVDGIITAKTIAGAQQYVNSGMAQYKGAETGFKLPVGKNFKMNGSVSYVSDAGSDAGFLRDNKLASVPEYILRYGLDYIPMSNLNFSLWGRSYPEVDGYEPFNNNKMAGWSTLDFTANYKLAALDFQLQVLNVADQKYYVADNPSNRLPLPRYECGYQVSVGYMF